MVLWFMVLGIEVT